MYSHYFVILLTIFCSLCSAILITFQVVMLLRQFDKDGNGQLDIEEFGSFYAEAKAT